MKAFGLVGLIIVALFFAVHTLLGAVAPKKKTQTGPASTSTSTAVPGPPPPTGAPVAALQSPTSVEEAFPVDKAVTSAKKIAESERSVPDPFIQLREPDNPSAHLAFSHTAKKGSEPGVQIENASLGKPLGGLPILGGGGNGLAGAGTGPAALTIAPIEPEIKVIGLVHGDSTVATVSVGGLIQIARPGDVLAKGYRLMQVSEEGIVVRHNKEYTNLRVGAVMNTPQAKS
jgi:hypothetical protein